MKPHDPAHGLRAVEYRGIVLLNLDFLIGQIRSNGEDGLAPFDAVVEATVQRSRPVILTALAAMLAFIPLTLSVFWGTLAYTLIGGTVLTLVFLPALYAIWFSRAGGKRGASRFFDSTGACRWLADSFIPTLRMPEDSATSACPNSAWAGLAGLEERTCLLVRGLTAACDPRCVRRGQRRLQCGPVQVQAVRGSAGLLAPGLGERAGVEGVEAQLVEQAEHHLLRGWIVAGD